MGHFRLFDNVTSTKFAQSVVATGCIILFIAGAIPLVAVVCLRCVIGFIAEMSSFQGCTLLFLLLLPIVFFFFLTLNLVCEVNAIGLVDSDR